MIREQKTFCRICDVACGMIATVDAGRITKLRPNPDHVVSQGFACPKGLAYHEIVHSPDRIQKPLKRIGSVSDPKGWSELSWNRALDEIGAGLRKIIDESGPDAVAIYIGNGAGFGFLHPFWAQGFMMGIGSKSLYGSATQDCSNKFAVAQGMYGFPMLQPVPDFEHSDTLVVLGANPVVTKFSFRGVPHPVKALRTAQENGCRIIHINPRRTESADAVGEHWPIRPETDVFFLLALLNELFRIGAVDLERIRRYMKNLEKLKEVCRPWTPERQQEVTTIPPDALRSLAADFSGDKRGVFYLSTGLNMGRHGALCGWLVEAINAVTGNLDRRGGSLVGRGSLIDFPRFGSRIGAMMSKKTSRIGEFESVNELFPGGVLADEILSPGEGRIRALLVAAGNPFLTLPDTNKTERAFRSLDLMVCVDIFRSATGNFADYVLPGITPYEHPDLGYIFHSMMGIGHRRFLQYTDQVVDPIGESRDELRIWQDLCTTAGGKFFGSGFLEIRGKLRKRLSIGGGLLAKTYGFSHERILDRFLRLTGNPGVKQMRRRPEGLLKTEPNPGSFLGRRVRNKDRKVDLAPSNILDDCRRLNDDFATEKSLVGRLKLVNMRKIRTQNSFMQNSPTLMDGKHGTNRFHIHPDDAAANGLVDGDDAIVWNDVGCVRIPVRISERMMPGSVAIPFGWGHQRSTGLRTASKTGGANVNYLIPSGPEHVDRPSLMAHLSGISVNAAPSPKGIPIVILSGGESRRFGSDKNFADWNGRGLLEHVTAVAEEITGEIFLSVSNPKPFKEFPFPLIVDPDPSIRSPLNGLRMCARLFPEYFMVLAADSPGISQPVIKLLLDKQKNRTTDTDMQPAPIIIAEKSTLYPFPGIYHSSHSEYFESAWDRERYSLTRLVKSMNPNTLNIEDVREVDPKLRCLKNINTPEELAAID